MRLLTEEEKDYVQYKKEFTKYNDLMETNLEEYLRNSHTRLLVSNFLKDYILETTDLQQNTYINYLRFIDSWFSYESIIKTLERLGYTNKSTTKPEKLIKEILELSGCNKIIESSLNNLCSSPGSIEQISKVAYYRMLLSNDAISKNQEEHLKNLIKKIEAFSISSITIYEFLALCYAIRNSYAHNGETARAGTLSYSIKIEILESCYHLLLRIMYRYCSFVYSNLIKNIS